MLDTLHETENGAALAANQVGVLKRLVVIDFNDTRLKLVNPQMISQSGVQECVEGCLSFPNRFVKTIRPQKVTIQALNEYHAGASGRGRTKPDLCADTGKGGRCPCLIPQSWICSSPWSANTPAPAS